MMTVGEGGAPRPAEMLPDANPAAEGGRWVTTHIDRSRYRSTVEARDHECDVAARPVVLTTRGGCPLIASANKDGLLSGIDRSRVGRERAPLPGGLVLTGRLSGEAIALDARDGCVLWSDQKNNAIGGGVITYALGGKQYVAVAAGLHAANWPAPARTKRIDVYALP